MTVTHDPKKYFLYTRTKGQNFIPATVSKFNRS